MSADPLALHPSSAPLSVQSLDEQALTALYDCHGAGAFAIALRVMGDEDEATTIVTDAFLEIARGGRVSYPVDGVTPGAWLLVLVRDRAIRRLQSTGALAGRIAMVHGSLAQSSLTREPPDGAVAGAIAAIVHIDRRDSPVDTVPS